MPSWIFGNKPHEAFGVSSRINILAIAAYHGGMDFRPGGGTACKRVSQLSAGAKLDAVAVAVRSGMNQPISYDRLYLSKAHMSNGGDKILKALLKPQDIEDRSRVGLIQFPMSLQDRLRLAGNDP